MTCEICEQPCLQCFGITSNCTECYPGYYLSNGFCLLAERADIAYVLQTNVLNTSSNSVWLDETATFCPNETWAIGFNFYTDCEGGYGGITIDLYCDNYLDNQNYLVKYVNDPNFNDNSSWGITQFCSFGNFINGKFYLQRFAFTKIIN